MGLGDRPLRVQAQGGVEEQDGQLPPSIPVKEGLSQLLLAKPTSPRGKSPVHLVT
jgi:hypothetical protein